MFAWSFRFVLVVTLVAALFFGMARAYAAAPLLGDGVRVLMIGDSQVVGTYGEEMHRLLRSTGARVEQVGVAGARPDWFLMGTEGRSGWKERHADGQVSAPRIWNTPRATPRLANLLSDHRPDVVIISLGGNMRGYSDSWIEDQTRRLLDVASSTGARVIWVSSPQRLVDQTNPYPYTRFTSLLERAVGTRAIFVDSSRLSRYAGGDGVHYSGALGSERAREWANGVFEAFAPSTLAAR